MAITKLNEIWDVLSERFSRDEWIHLQHIYEMIQNSIQLKPDDFLPSTPNWVAIALHKDNPNYVQSFSPHLLRLFHMFCRAGGVTAYVPNRL